MFSVPFEFKCSACGREPTIAGWNLCALCSGFFCSAHLIVKKGVATCASCAVEREQREESSDVSTEDEARVVSLLRADVEATIGAGHDDAIIEAAARRRLYADGPTQYVGDVVDEVQQYFHDTFIDTTWPACPHHPNHPLWFSDGWWRCGRVEEPIARLGALSGANREHGG
ncbi:MAG: hypothetical protein QM736_11950 [Vicinamibacterales bacterium]